MDVPERVRLKPPAKPAVEIARALPTIELSHAAAEAFAREDDISAMLLAQEAARRLAGEPGTEDWLRHAKRIAAEMEWNGGEPGPLFDRSKERLGLLTPEGELLFVGTHALAFLGLPSAALIGQRLSERFPALAIQMMPQIKRVAAGGIVTASGWFEARGDRAHCTYVLVPVWRGGRVVAILLVGADTTESARSRRDATRTTKL